MLCEACNTKEVKEMCIKILVLKFVVSVHLKVITLKHTHTHTHTYNIYVYI